MLSEKGGRAASKVHKRGKIDTKALPDTFIHLLMI